MTPPSPAKLPPGYKGAFALIVILFFTWGFLTSLNDVLVAALRSIFNLTYRDATLVQFTFFSTCFVFSFPSSKLVTRFGYRGTMVFGLLTMSLAALCFVGASSVATFGMFLLALAVMAAGSTGLQTAAGPYVTLLGPEASASSRFSLALGVNSLGAMLAPTFGAWLILHNVPGRVAQAADLRRPYLLIAVGLVCVAGVVQVSRLPEVRTPLTVMELSAGRYRDLLARPRFTFGLLAMFLYVGAEISIGGLMINFLHQPDTSAFSLQRAALFASLYGGGAMIGRFAGWIVLKRLRPQRVLWVAAMLAFSLVMVSVLTSGSVSSFSLLAVGLCNSVMVPIIFTAAVSGLGDLTGKGSGCLVAALVGGALIPMSQGVLADRFGLHRSFLLPAFCYVAIFGYGLFLSRRGGAREVTVQGI